MYPSTNLQAVNQRVSDVEDQVSVLGSDVGDLEEQVSMMVPLVEAMDVPWIDLRPWLANGWEALGSQTVVATVLRDVIVWSISVTADNATSPRIFEGLPRTQEDVDDGHPVLVSQQNARLLMMTTEGTAEIQLQRSSGTMYATHSVIEDLGGYSGTFSIQGIMRQGSPV